MAPIFDKIHFFKIITFFVKKLFLISNIKITFNIFGDYLQVIYILIVSFININYVFFLDAMIN